MGDLNQSAATAAEVVRSFSYWKSVAANEPVSITHHGHRTHVLISASLFESLAGEDVEHPASSVPDEVVGLADWIDEGLIICDDQMCITHSNRVANAIFRVSQLELIGRQLHDALPSISGTLFDVHIKRTLVGGEPSAADIPSPFTEGAWLRFQCFPLNRRTVIMFRDITEDVRSHRLADVKAAILEAMSVHGAIGYVRLSIRGTIERVDAPFCEIINLSEERLLGVAIVDLVSRDDRVAFRDQMERVLAGGKAARFTCSFFSNKEDFVPMKVAMVPLKGAYGAEGAVALLTHHTD